VKLTAGEDTRLRAKGTRNLQAYLKLMEARKYTQKMNKEAEALARKLAEEAIALDPQYAYAYATRCEIQNMGVILGVYKNPREALEQSLEFAKRAVALDPSGSYPHSLLARCYWRLKEHDKAIPEAEKAVSLDPNSASAYHTLGSLLDYAGQPQEALSFLKKSLSLSPIPENSTTLVRLGATHINLGQYEEAVAAFKKTLQIFGPDQVLAHQGLVRAYMKLGREKEARVELEEILRIDPKFSVLTYVKTLPYKDQRVIDDYVSDFRKAALK
jgi:adenylate cyclase